MKKKISLSQIGLYNPQRISDNDVENLFVVRTKLFSFLIDKLKKEKTDSIPQHYLIIAQRGMGKTTMLKRIEVELRKPDFNQLFIPLLFPEEQYNMKNLSEFWLNSLDALADTLEVEKQHEEVVKIDIKVKELGKINSNEELANEAYKFLKSICFSLNRRPVLLIDNMNLIFDRLEKAEQHTLRAWLMQNGAPVLIGASAVAIEGTTDYGAPFYDAFQIHYLKRLSFDELKEVLINLANLTQSEDVIPMIEKEVGRIRTLHQLTGGNPRTAVMLFRLIIKGFSKEINDDLEALLDEITPLYKARFEELSTQMQVIVDAIALHWDPINLEQLREASHYENNQLSPQLKRLVELGWIEKLDAYKAKGGAYQISERFFNIWFLMRRSSRRQKKELYCLSRFLESFYGEDIQSVAEARLLSKATCIDHVTYSLALAEAVKDESIKCRLRTKSYIELKEFAKEDSQILSVFDIPTEYFKNELSILEDELTLNIDKMNFIECEKIIRKAIVYSKENNTLQAKYSRQLGLNYAVQEKYVDTEREFRKSINLNDKDALTWFYLGNLYFWNLKELEDSETAYLKAIELDASNANYKSTLGDLYYNKNKYEDAEKMYLKALEIESDNGKSWNKLGYIYNKMNRFVEAKEAYEQAVNIDDSNSEYWLDLGFLDYFKLDNCVDAEKSFLKSLSLNEKNDFLWNVLGILYHYDLKKYKEAENAFLKAISINENDSMYWSALGDLYNYSLNEFQKALDAYKTAILIEPDDSKVKLILIELLVDSFDELNEAEKIFNTIKINDELADNYWLNSSLFDLYKKNEGLAKESLNKVLGKIETNLPVSIKDDWWRFGAMVNKLGYGNWLLAILEEKGYDIILSPYYVAIKAMNEKDADGYLNSKAVEIREPARKLMELMQKY